MTGNGNCGKRIARRLSSARPFYGCALRGPEHLSEYLSSEIPRRPFQDPSSRPRSSQTKGPPPMRNFGLRFHAHSLLSLWHRRPGGIRPQGPRLLSFLRRQAHGGVRRTPYRSCSTAGSHSPMGDSLPLAPALSPRAQSQSVVATAPYLSCALSLTSTAKVPGKKVLRGAVQVRSAASSASDRL